jgi:hypothetical protein
VGGGIPEDAAGTNRALLSFDHRFFPGERKEIKRQAADSTDSAGLGGSGLMNPVKTDQTPSGYGNIPESRRATSLIKTYVDHLIFVPGCTSSSCN